MANRIPDSSRDQVKQRERWRCARCHTPCPNGEWHHRRSRLVRDRHRHCPCNGVLLCGTCHRWVHAHPVEARATGFIVSKFTSEPATVPIQNPLGVRWQDCEGGTRYDSDNREASD